ncbi:hypothetical protein OC846_002671 [Tilletia horrida]|uniref:Senescence domain-containing protein n=1 Tax=Tilletia horrida TaxID=155126 RepID=A0AAN6JUQ1_9BASI|nr:hypothetical protein OC845_002399 [Tilletia horrida]KAK0553055.1 hypothetical protein OC846_002671 [Tilletia horrida]KAK0569707.1 hypothetical protein OC861_000669 [Tilletia horrida]
MTGINTPGGPRGVELLNIDGVELWEAQPASRSPQAALDTTPTLTNSIAQGSLTVLLVTIDVEDPSHTSSANADVWLVLNIHNPSAGSDRPFPVLATQRVVPVRIGASNSYRFLTPPHQSSTSSSPSSDVVLKLPPARAQLGPDQKTPFELDPGAEAYLEDILAQYCAFEQPSDAFTETSSISLPPPSTAPSLPPRGGQGEIELFDEHGNLFGHLEGTIQEDPSLKKDALTSSRGLDAKNPVLIDFDTDGSSGPRVSPLDAAAAAEQEQDGNTDWLIRSAQVIGRGLVKGSVFLGSKMTSAADAYIEKNPSKRAATIGPHQATAATEKDVPISFTGSETDAASLRSNTLDTTPSGAKASAPERYATTQTGQASRSHGLHKFTSQAVSISHTTTSAILSVASSVGDRVGKATGIQRQSKPDGTLGPAPKGVRGFLNRGIIAASSLLDSLEQAGETLLTDGGTAASRVIGHKYGADAERRTGNVALAGRNLYLVYKDLAGVRRRCLIRTVVGSSLKARTPSGEVVEIKLDGKTPVAPSSASGKARADGPPPPPFSEKP